MYNGNKILTNFNGLDFIKNRIEIYIRYSSELKR